MVTLRWTIHPTPVDGGNVPNLVDKKMKRIEWRHCKSEENSNYITIYI